MLILLCFRCMLDATLEKHQEIVVGQQGDMLVDLWTWTHIHQLMQPTKANNAQTNKNTVSQFQHSQHFALHAEIHHICVLGRCLMLSNGGHFWLLSHAQNVYTFSNINIPHCERHHHWKPTPHKNVQRTIEVYLFEASSEPTTHNLPKEHRHHGWAERRLSLGNHESLLTLD